MCIINRINEVIKDKSLSLKDFVNAIDGNYRTTQAYLSGERKVSAEFIKAITEQLRVSATWLLTGQGEKYLDSTHNRRETSPEFVQVQRYDVSASAGHGAFTDEHEMSLGWYAFNRKWLDRRGFKPNNLSIIQVMGDSMEPKFSDKDLVLLDHAQSTPHDGHIYAINYDNALYIKAIQRAPNDTLNLISSNKDYPIISINMATEGDGVIVVGRVVASMHEW